MHDVLAERAASPDDDGSRHLQNFKTQMRLRLGSMLCTSGNLPGATTLIKTPAGSGVSA